MNKMYKSKEETPSQYCVVCGDVALCVNYGVITCSSCKSFFRRYARSSEHFRCFNQKACFMSKQSRNSCKRCRMDRCLKVGMKKQLILVRKNNNSQNEPANGIDNAAGDCETTTIEEAIPLKRWQHSINHDNTSTQRNPIYIMYNSESVELKPFELGRLYEVQQALAGFSNENSLRVLGEPTNVHAVMHLTAVYVKKIITFCKKLKPFLGLPQMNQMILLKNLIPEKLFVRAAFLYQPERDGWNWLADETGECVYFIPGSIFRTPESRQYKFPDNSGIIKAMHSEMEGDIIIQNLIQALLLFKHRPGISNTEYLHYHNVFYRYLLRRYLEHKYGKLSIAAEKYATLLHLLSAMDCYNATMQRIHSAIQMNTSNLPEVLVEIYDLEKKEGDIQCGSDNSFIE